MKQATQTTAFSLGQILITANAQGELNADDVAAAIRRHARGDWGDLPAEDRAENELSLKAGFRLLSVYRDRSQKAFWIITEADRRTTTVLLPEDY